MRNAHARHSEERNDEESHVLGNALGFSTAELVIVFALMLLSLGITAVLGGWTQSLQELDRAKEIIRNDLFMSRKDSISGTGDASWGVKFTTNTITRFQGTSYASRNTDYDAFTDFGSGITINGPSEIVFLRPGGIPSAYGTTTITDGRRTVTSTVNAVGGIDFP